MIPRADRLVAVMCPKISDIKIRIFNGNNRNIVIHNIYIV